MDKSKPNQSGFSIILAADLLGYDSATLKKLVEQKKLIEVNNDE